MVKTARPQAPVVFGTSKVRVQVSADGSSYEGDVHLHGDARRIQEVLNDPRPFLNLTDVSIRSEGGGTTKASYVALNKGAITHVLVLGDDAVASIGASGSAPAGGAAAPTVGHLALPNVPVHWDSFDSVSALRRPFLRACAADGSLCRTAGLL